MPVVPIGSFILVTGATGFIASHIIYELLRRGFDVRGTVRTAAKGEFLKYVFREAGDRFSYFIVEDLQTPGGFNDAVKDVQGILHVASPLYRTAASGVWENIIEPAKTGTTNLLSAALRHNPAVKRIVVTSSISAILDQNRGPGTVFSEDDWNMPALDHALAMGNDLDPIDAYSASKVWAEQAAWDFMKTEEPAFDLVTILPSLVCGPVIHPVTAPSSLNTSNFMLWGYLTGSKDLSTESASKMPTMPMVDVRDVAIAHVEALLRPEAANKRIGISESNYLYQELLDIIQANPGLVTAFPNANWGVQGARCESLQYQQDASLSKVLLGLRYRHVKDTVLEVVRSLLRLSTELGWNVTSGILMGS